MDLTHKSPARWAEEDAFKGRVINAVSKALNDGSPLLLMVDVLAGTIKPVSAKEPSDD